MRRRDEPGFQRKKTLLGDTVLWFGGDLHPKDSCGKGWVASQWVWKSEWTTGLQPPQWIPKLIEYVNEEVGPGWRMSAPGDVPLMQGSLKGIFLTQLLRPDTC